MPQTVEERKRAAAHRPAAEAERRRTSASPSSATLKDWLVRRVVDPIVPEEPLAGALMILAVLSAAGALVQRIGNVHLAQWAPVALAGTSCALLCSSLTLRRRALRSPKQRRITSVRRRWLTVLALGGLLAVAVLAGLLLRPDPPEIEAVEPGTVARGVPASVVLTGENFRRGAQVLVDDELLADAAVEDLSSGAIRANVLVSRATSLGMHSVTIVNPDGRRASCECLRVAFGEPVITSVDPSRMVAGSEVDVVVAGQEFDDSTNVSSSIRATFNVTRLDETTIVASVAVGESVAPGSYPIVVSTKQGRAVGRCPDACIEITAPPPPPPPTPVIQSIEPSQLERGSAQQTITIRGTSFPESLPPLTIDNGDGTSDSRIKVHSVVRKSNSELTARISISRAAYPGARRVTLAGIPCAGDACVLRVQEIDRTCRALPLERGEPIPGSARFDRRTVADGSTFPAGSNTISGTYSDLPEGTSLYLVLWSPIANRAYLVGQRDGRPAISVRVDDFVAQFSLGAAEPYELMLVVADVEAARELDAIFNVWKEEESYEGLSPSEWPRSGSTWETDCLTVARSV